MCRRLSYLVYFALANVAIGDVWEGRVSQNTDNSEELDPQGTPEGSSSDLEFPYEDAGKGEKQFLAIRWQDVNVPKSATIGDAWIEFTVDEIGEGTLHVSVIIEGELNPNPPTFTFSAAQAIYEPEHWTTVGAKHQTSNIAVVIEEIVNQPGWVSGNALVLIFRDNPANPSDGRRVAESYDDPENAPLLHIEYTLGNASGASPADGAIDVPRDVVLSWTPGVFAAPVNGHKFYFSENFNAVNDGIDGITQSAASYDAGRLKFGTTYYWRVDEVNAPPDSTVFPGKVWSFTIEPDGIPIADVTATASSSAATQGPASTVVDGLGLTDDLHSTETLSMWASAFGAQPTWIQFEFDRLYSLHEMWVWNSNSTLEPDIGYGFRDVTIEYSLDGVEFATLGTTHEFDRAPGADGYAHNTTIGFGGVQAKHVKLTVNTNWAAFPFPQFGLSEVRFFSIPLSAREPSPDSGAADVDVDVVLGWRAGREAATHNVYLNTDEQAVTNGTATAVSVTDASYSSSDLDLASTYYWRIDEVNEAETPTTWQGDVWDFTTKELEQQDI